MVAPPEPRTLPVTEPSLTSPTAGEVTLTFGEKVEPQSAVPSAPSVVVGAWVTVKLPVPLLRI
jgi:hypothetical protein